MRRPLLALKAEVVFGLLVTVRHRTVRLAAALAAVLVAVAATGSGDGERAADRTVLVVAGSLAAVAASRVLCRGPALAAVRRAAAPWWLPPVGRLAGVWALVMVIALASSLALRHGGGADLCLLVVTGWYVAALGALVAALAPASGASGAGALGLLAAWLGGLPPSAILAMLAEWPYVQRPLGWLWNVLPLDWRAARWLAAPGWGEAAIFAFWAAAGVALAAWGAGRAYRGDAPRNERV